MDRGIAETERSIKIGPWPGTDLRQHGNLHYYIAVSGHLLCLPAFYRELAPFVLAGWHPHQLLYCSERAPFVLAGTLP